MLVLKVCEQRPMGRYRSSKPFACGTIIFRIDYPTQISIKIDVLGLKVDATCCLVAMRNDGFSRHDKRHNATS